MSVIPRGGRWSRRCRRQERGAVAILVALAMVALTIATAFVLELGLVRVDRQQNKSAADAAAMSGIDALVPDSTKPTDFRPYAGVCQALRYLRVNLPDFTGLSGSWTDGNGTAVSDGCTSAMAAAKCVKDAPNTWARFTGTTTDGRIKVRIQSGYKVSDGGFSEEALPALQADPGVLMYGGCDQLAVIITETRQPALGALAAGDVVSTIRSVGRVDITPPKAPVALLILDQKDCAALIVNGSGDDTYVRVKYSVDLVTGNQAPGRIHMDSDGSGDNCSSKKVISTGTNHADAVKAFASATTPGIIEVVAKGGPNDGLAADPYPNVNAEGGSVTHGEVLTRAPVDRTYLQGVQQGLNLVTAPWNYPPPSPLPADDAVVTDCKNATNGAAAAQSKTGTVYFVCPANGPGSTLGFDANLTFQAKKVVVNTMVDTSGKKLAFPNATEVWIKGASSPSPTEVGLNVKGTFAVGANASSGCVNTVASTVARKLVIGSGRIDMNDNGSNLRFCDTTVLMGSGYSNGCVPATEGTYYDDGRVCPVGGPTGSSGNGYLNITGGNIDWSAPNRYFHTVVPDADRPTVYGIGSHEDLAFWSETSGTHTLRSSSSGTMKLTGVFMVPNADQFDLGGNGNQYVENSQYVVKKFNVHGGARLDMQPDPNDTVTVPEVGFSLVR